MGEVGEIPLHAEVTALLREAEIVDCTAKLVAFLFPVEPLTDSKGTVLTQTQIRAQVQMTIRNFRKAARPQAEKDTLHPVLYNALKRFAS